MFISDFLIILGLNKESIGQLRLHGQAANLLTGIIPQVAFNFCPIKIRTRRQRQDEVLGQTVVPKGAINFGLILLILSQHACF